MAATAAEEYEGGGLAMSALPPKVDGSNGCPSMLLFPQSFESSPCYTRIKYRVPRIAVS